MRACVPAKRTNDLLRIRSSSVSVFSIDPDHQASFETIALHGPADKIYFGA